MQISFSVDQRVTREPWKKNEWAPPASVVLRWESNPRHAAWEAAVLPLNYARDGMRLVERGQGGKGVRGVLGLREGRQVEAMWLGLIFDLWMFAIPQYRAPVSRRRTNRSYPRF